MLKSSARRRRWKRHLASAMALAMAVANLSVAPVSAAGAGEEQLGGADVSGNEIRLLSADPTGGTEYILDVGELAAETLSANKTVGSSNYFTLTATSGKKLTVEDNSKTFTAAGREHHGYEAPENRWGRKRDGKEHLLHCK